MNSRYRQKGLPNDKTTRNGTDYKQSMLVSWFFFFCCVCGFITLSRLASKYFCFIRLCLFIAMNKAIGWFLQQNIAQHSQQEIWSYQLPVFIGVMCDGAYLKTHPSSGRCKKLVLCFNCKFCLKQYLSKT